MIRINLLGTSKAKKGKRSGGISMPTLGEGPNPVLLIAVGLGLAIAGNAYWYQALSSKSAKIAAERQTAESERVRLSNVKKKYDERKKQAELYERRVKVIDELRAAQSGPVNLLNTVSQTVNNTDAVWLLTMKDAGASIDVEGTALSTTAVANLITNLKKTSYFKTIELKETGQDDSIKEVQAFSFKLSLEKAPATAPAQPAAQGQKS